LVSKKGSTELKEIQLDKVFQEFQSKFNVASPEEKSHLATQFYSWVQQQMESLDIPTPGDQSGSFPRDRAHPKLTTTESLLNKHLQVPILQNLKSLIENEPIKGENQKRMEKNE